MSGIETVTMPKWGMEMVEGEIVEWHVSEGDSIAAGDDLVDVETSKIVNTVTAPAGGVVRRILASSGDIIPVGQVLAVIAAADVSDADIDSRAGGVGSGMPAPDPVAAEAVSTSVVKSSPARTGDVVAATPVARRVALEQGIDLSSVAASGRHGRVTLADVEAALVASGLSLNKSYSPARPELAPTRDDSAVAATPVARRLAKNLGINLLDCRASGRHDRVSKADVEAVAARTQPTLPAARGAEVISAPCIESQTLSSIRRTIANRLQASKREAPHFRVQVDVEVDALLELRAALNGRFSEAKVSVNDLLVKACACALTTVPGVNVQFDGTTIQHFADADIAVAVALEDGLITPIVRSANRKGILAISSEIQDLVARAKMGTLLPEEFQGGSFSVSNLGMFGVDRFDAIINSPQGAILAAGAAEQRPVVKNGELAVATVLTLSLSSDHRIIDGALAAQFLAALRGFLETPATMLA